MPLARRHCRGFSRTELGASLLLLASLALVVWARVSELTVDAEQTLFRQHLLQARSAIQATRSQAVTKAGQGRFVVDGCVGHIDAQGNGTACLNDGVAVTVAGFNLTCADGLGQASWFQQDSTYQGIDASNQAGQTMVLLPYASVAGRRCILSCTNGDGASTLTRLRLRPDLGEMLGVPGACPVTLDPNRG
jgi:hypothetical protein